MTVIKVENLGKSYLIKHQGVQQDGTIRDAITYTIKNLGQKIIHPRKAALKAGTAEEFWALKDVSFEVQKGDRIGVIGRNGAGKSTLLKMLSRITEPTTGRISIKGRVASLLEVGTGFHPELSGRENIFLNGAILGMKRSEIKRKFNEIVAFSEVEKFIDTPVKRYSSGMYVRLAFAVAAHLEPEILIVDEVLAVGDIQFQKKCLGKMEEVSGEGRTVLFVSHNMGAIKNLCSKAILLEGGQNVCEGTVNEVVERYLSGTQTNSSYIDVSGFISKFGNKEVELLSVELVNAVGGQFAIPWDQPIEINFRIKVNKTVSNGSIAFGCKTMDNLTLFTVRSSDNNIFYEFEENKEYTITLRIPHNLRAGLFTLSIGIGSGRYSPYYYNTSLANLEILNVGEDKYIDINNGILNYLSEWFIKNENNF